MFLFLLLINKYSNEDYILVIADQEKLLCPAIYKREKELFKPELNLKSITIKLKENTYILLYTPKNC